MLKKSILFIIPHLNGGGAEKVLVDILNNFDYDKYDVDLLVFFEEGVYIKYIPNNVNVKFLINKVKFINKVPGKLKDLFSVYIKYFGMKFLYKKTIKKKYDIEISFLEGLSTKFIYSSNNKDSKKLAWVHTDLFNNHWTDKYYKSLYEEINVYKRFDDIICVSEDAKEAFRKKFGEFKNISVIYNPLDIDNIKKLGSEPIKKNKKFTICSVGRLVPQKGFDRLINIAKKLVDENYDINIQILGIGGELKKLERMIEDYSLSNNVQLVGFVENPYKYIKNCDIFVSASRNEGFSLVVAEALILNKPIISTRCAGPIEILQDGEYGIITENSENGIYEAIKLIYNDDKKRNYFINKTEERKKFFLIEDKMSKIYKLL